VLSYNQPASVDSVVINEEEIEESEDENDQAVPKKRNITVLLPFLASVTSVPHCEGLLGTIVSRRWTIGNAGQKW